jgi:hypothetical protein
LGILTSLVPAQQKPDQIKLSIWVREDIFAGFLADDESRLDVGMGKLETALRADPNDAAAIVWRGSGEFTKAVHAYEAGRPGEFSREYANARASFERAVLLDPKRSGVYAVIAVTNASLADRLPDPLRQTAYEQAYQSWLMDRQLSDTRFASMSEHSRGEMLAALAHSAKRLGKSAESERYLAEMIAKLPGTPFEARAKRWIERPELLARARISCQSCHEPGRLVNQLPASERRNQ